MKVSVSFIFLGGSVCAVCRISRGCVGVGFGRAPSGEGPVGRTMNEVVVKDGT